MKLVYQVPHIAIWYDDSNDWLYANWKGDQSLDTTVSGGFQMLEIVKRMNLTKVLNDNREVTNSWSEAAHWGGNVWLPKMLSAGVTYFAWIYSPFVFSRLSADVLISFANHQGPEIATFDTLEDASSWLKAQG